jgi:hypothetical protein
MKTIFRFFLLGILMLNLTACATNSLAGDEMIRHAFGFDRSEFDGQAGVDRIQVLDYVYGNPDGYAIRNPCVYHGRGRCMQGEAVRANTMRSDLKIFYMKWLDKQTGKVHEVTIDLVKKLPKDFSRKHRFFASFKQGQLYVYVITPRRRAENEPAQGPSAYDYLKMILLYPEQ